MTDLVPVHGQAVSTFDIMPSCWELAQKITRTEFVPTALRGKPEAVMACMLTGHEVGMPPMMALKQIHVIEGRPTLSAEGMRALVLSNGHEVWFEDITNTRVTIVGVRAGTTRETRITWTMDDAKRAGLDGKQNWRKYPRGMLEARATGELCRLIFADVIGGISYVREEIDDGILFEVDEPASDGNGDTPTQPRKAATTRKRAAKKAAAPPAKAGPQPEAPLPPLPGEDGTPPIETTAREEPAGESAEVVTQRAQQIAMRANNAGLDHHRVIEAVTFGAKSSAKEVTGDEGAEVLMAIREIAQGRKALDETEDGWRIVDVAGGASEDPGSGDVVGDPGSGSGEDEEASGPPPSSPPTPPPPTPSLPATPGTGDEGTWDGDAWRAYLREKGVTVAAALTEARDLAKGMDIKQPSRLEDISAGGELLAQLVRGYVDNAALEREG